MDAEKTGKIIYTLRREKGLTQKSLADQMNISDKTVSKWERGLGCPDLSLLNSLAGILGVGLENLLDGELITNEMPGGNMKNIKFYVCPECGNILTSSSGAALCCCAKKLPPLSPVKAENDGRLNVEIIENDYFISTPHEMTKEHYIDFCALVTADTIVMKRLYPEWNMQLRIPRIGHGKLIWHCTRDGLFYQLI